MDVLRNACCIALFFSLFFMTSVFAAPPTAAQVAAKLPTTVEPGLTAETVSKKPEIEAPMLSPLTQVQMLHGQTLSKEVASLRLNLKHIVIQNAVVFSCEELLAPFKKYFGKTVTLGEIQSVAQQITTRYQQAGYILTQVIIPPQKIHDGVVILKVVSGYIDKIEVSGDIRCDLKELLLQYGAEIHASRPLQLKVLERYTLLANDIPGVTVQVVLKPSKDTPEASDLTFVAEQKSFSGYASVNNYGTRYLGPVQGVIGGEADSILRAGDLTAVQYVTTANNQLNFVEVRHSQLVGIDGLRLGVLGQYLYEVPGFTLKPFSVKGTYDVGGADFMYPLLRSRIQNFSLNGGLLVQRSKTTILNNQLLYDDRIRPAFLGFVYNRQDSFNGVSQFALTLTQGLKIWGASGNTKLSRPHGKSDFTKFNSSLSRLQQLPYDFSFFAIAEGQYSFETLLASQQFGVGGSYIGRGYDPYEIAGDSGVSGSLELRYDKPFFPGKFEAQFYVFYDGGIVWNRDLTIFPPHASETSTGIGVRLKILKRGEAGVYVAKPLTRKVATFNNKDIRGFFSLLIHF